MKVKEVAIGRKYNLGNYENMDIHVTASVGENENPVEVLQALEKVIMDYWSGRTSTLIAKNIGKEGVE